MRTISEGQAIELLRIHFDFEAPVAFEDVKKKYRRECRLLHPDVEGGSESAFKAFGGAFDNLKQLYQNGSPLFDAEPLEEIVEGEPQLPKMPRVTVDGTPLSELGLGLGPTTNGRECLHCEQRGYTITKEHAKGRCQKCSGSGRHPREYPCRPCRGSGKFTQRRSGRVVDCLGCNGAGKFRHPFQKEYCAVCHGSGKAPTDRVANIYAMKCHDCNGTGETEVWNPVLPKGRLIFTGKPPAQTETSAPVTKGPGEDRLFQKDPNRMENLLHELRVKGVGGKR
jgi:hypothetical protein